MLRLLSGIVVLIAGILLALFARDTLGGAAADLTRGLDPIPSPWERTLLGITEVGIVASAISLAVFLAVTRRRRLLAWLAATVVVASTVTFGIGLLLANNRVEVLAGVSSAQERFLADPAFPSSGLMAGVTAGLIFGSPWLTDRWRRAGWATIGLLVIERAAFAADPSVDVVAAIGVGIVVGAAVLLMRGAPSLEPSGGEIVDALRGAGVEPIRVEQLAPGHTTVTYRIRQDDGEWTRLGLRTAHDRSAGCAHAPVAQRAPACRRSGRTVQHDPPARGARGPGPGDGRSQRRPRTPAPRGAGGGRQRHRGTRTAGVGHTAAG
ncbi:MAG: hypothetical protein M5U19_16010 [Microthrixaceae bacterium]|nr:hypothetical protein [Microthrixaceae bacterium]